MRRCITKRFVGILTAIAIAGAGGPTSAGTENDEATTAFFSGRIDSASVGAFIEAHRDDAVRRLVVDSPGGSIGDALVLANWILDHAIDVEVRGSCFSSCANYLFVAGRRRIIGDRSIVVWHGSALQKDFRERAMRCEPAAGDEAFCAQARDLMTHQQAFFERIDGSEYITRLGQEPHDFGAVWTVPVEAMKRLGYRDVEAPAGYGSAEYLRHFNTVEAAEPIVSLGLRDDGTVYLIGP